MYWPSTGVELTIELRGEKPVYCVLHHPVGNGSIMGNQA